MPNTDIIIIGDICVMVAAVVLPDPFRGMEAMRNSEETQQSGYASRSVPEIKDGRSKAKDSTPERFLAVGRFSRRS